MTLRAPNSQRGCHPHSVLLVLVASVIVITSATAQTPPADPYYSRVNTFGFLASYSNDSSHILMGQTEDRKLLSFGATYSRRLFQNEIVNWQYQAEILPIALESDPVEHEVITYTLPEPGPPLASDFEPATACHSGSGTTTFSPPDGTVYSYNYVITCSRRWTMGEGMSPVGFAWNFLPRRKLQPVFLAHGGYMFSTKPIPVDEAGSFNFTFDFGAGLELYRTRTRSIRLDYRFHHISNHDTANQNPGIDNGLFTLTYSFGR